MHYAKLLRLKQERERAAQAAAGLVSERYAGVSSIRFRMTYFYRALDPVLMKRTLSFSPTDYALFHITCMEAGCTGGGYDLAPVVAGLARSGRRSVKGTIFCHGENTPAGHASIGYEVNIRYRQGKA